MYKESQDEPEKAGPGLCPSHRPGLSGLRIRSVHWRGLHALGRLEPPPQAQLPAYRGENLDTLAPGSLDMGASCWAGLAVYQLPSIWDLGAHGTLQARLGL